MIKNKRGAVSIYLTFMFTAIFVLLIASVLAPMGVLINTEFYAMGEDIMLQANQSIEDINNASVRNSIRASVNSGLNSLQDNIEVNADIFKYSWIIVIILSAMVLFLFTRRITEYTGGFV